MADFFILYTWDLQPFDLSSIGGQVEVASVMIIQPQNWPYFSLDQT